MLTNITNMFREILGQNRQRGERNRQRKRERRQGKRIRQRSRRRGRIRRERRRRRRRKRRRKRRGRIETRPDTRPISVADGWAGAEMRVFTLFNSCSRTNGPTDGQSLI